MRLRRRHSLIAVLAIAGTIMVAGPDGNALISGYGETVADMCADGCVASDQNLLRRVNVFGFDDRRLMTYNERRRLSAVGSIGFHGRRTTGTATVICTGESDPDRDYDVVISAAHLFYNLSGRLRSRQFYFYPGGPDSEPVPITGFRVGSTDPYHNFQHDWAVALLDRNISAEVGCLPYHSVGESTIAATRADGGRYLAAGLHNKFKLIAVSEDCGPVPKTPGDVAFGNDAFYNLDCDFLKGASGGPLIMVHKDMWFAIGVLVRMVNILETEPGDEFDPRFNPNQAVRVTGAFRDAIDDVTRTGRLRLSGASETPVIGK